MSTDNLVKCLHKAKSGPIRELRNALNASEGAHISWIEQESLEIKAVM
jgi:hypothetical protein